MRRRAIAAGVRGWWSRHGSVVVLVVVAAMVLGALWRLGQAVPFLLWAGESPHPTDLNARHGELARWFAGVFTDPHARNADYPPASYVVLWPLLGWLDASQARWLWGLTALVGLAVLGWLGIRHGGARSGTQRLLLFLLPFSTYAASATLTVGQLGNHVVPMLAVGVLALRRRPTGPWRDVAGAAAMLFALVKPILSAPFAWVAFLASGRWRPAALIVTGYGLLTVFAASFHRGDVVTIVTGWLEETPNLAAGTVNLHKALHLVGLDPWVLPATFATLLGFGWWVFRHRDADVWTLMGAAALVARLGFHHRLYDDVLVLIPMIALFRLAGARAGDEHGDRDVQAGVLFALVWVTLNMPAGVFSMAQPMRGLAEAGQAVVWTAALVFLLDAAGRGAGGASAAPRASFAAPRDLPSTRSAP